MFFSLLFNKLQFIIIFTNYFKELKMNSVSNINSIPFLPQQTIRHLAGKFLKITLVVLAILTALNLCRHLVKKLRLSRVDQQANQQLNLTTEFEAIKTTAVQLLENEYADSFSVKIILKLNDEENFDYENSSFIPQWGERTPIEISRQIDALFQQRTTPQEWEERHPSSLQCTVVIILKKNRTSFRWASAQKRIDSLESPKTTCSSNSLPFNLNIQNSLCQSAGIRNNPFFDEHGNLI